MNKNKNEEIIKKNIEKTTDEQKQKYIKAIKIHQKKNIGKNIGKLKSDIEKILLMNKNKNEEIIKENIIKNVIQQKS